MNRRRLIPILFGKGGTSTPVLAIPTNIDVVEQKLLFKSDFEGTVALGSLQGDWKYFSGSSLGYTFPTDGQLGMGTSGNAIHLIDNGTPSDVEAELVTVTGRLGTSTTVLRQKVVNQTNVNQVPWQFNNITIIPDEFYMSYWQKFDANFLSDQDGDDYDYRAIWEYKTANYALQDGNSARLILHAIKLNDDYYWRLQLDKKADGQPESLIWQVRSTDKIIPIDQWFKFEIYFKYRTDATGEAWVKINGEKVCEVINEPMTIFNVTNQEYDPIDFIMAAQCYGPSDGMEHWIDDVEIWNHIPESSVALYGTELATNGMFETDLSNWTDSQSHWSWVAGEAYHPYSTDYKPLATQNIDTADNSVEYRIAFNIRVIQGTAKFRYKNAATADVISTYTGTEFVEIFTSDVQSSTNHPMEFARNNGMNAEFYIDNFSVREVL